MGILWLLLPLTLLGQITYPPNTYPPNTYPPNTYPPNTYPPNTYPGPGGVGIQLPGITLPGRRQKAEAPQAKVIVASAEGTLRKLAEKELLLQVAPNRVLRFRLLAKTLFRDKNSKPVRDSLLHPGDRLSVEATPDDPETALHVILIGVGSKSDRTAASEPVTASIAPEESDLRKPRAVRVSGTPEEVPAPPPVSETAPDQRPALTRKPLPDQLTAAREAAVNFTEELPNFLVQQVTTRYQGQRAVDVVTADVASVDGKEEYRNIRVNGRPSTAPENTGSWSTGEFTITLEDIFAPSTAANFTLRGADHVAGRAAYVYDLAVEQSRSHWTIIAPDKTAYKPAYKGAIWIDQESNRVLRIEQVAVLPGSFVYRSAQTTIEYGFVNIEGKSYLLPVRSENMFCGASSSGCSRNTIEFLNYRKFGANTNITFDKFAAL